METVIVYIIVDQNQSEGSSERSGVDITQSCNKLERHTTRATITREAYRRACT